MCYELSWYRRFLPMPLEFVIRIWIVIIQFYPFSLLSTNWLQHKFPSMAKAFLHCWTYTGRTVKIIGILPVVLIQTKVTIFKCVWDVDAGTFVSILPTFVYVFYFGALWMRSLYVVLHHCKLVLLSLNLHGRSKFLSCS